jgi:uncharacterized protein (DUF1697 family)
MQYVAFLRGINVGGKTKVPMMQLRKVFEDAGFTNVKTLLNSGNVIFETSSQADLVSKIEIVLEKEFGWHIDVLLRSMDELQKLVQKEPFKGVKVTSEVRLYVTFLANQEICSVINMLDQGTTDLMGDLAKKYGKKITTRNWNTVKKISENHS